MIGFLVVQTLDDADKWASVFSAVVAVVGLLVSVVTMVGARQSPGRGGQSVTGSTVGGGVRQISDVDGNVRSGSSGSVPAVPLPGTPAAPATGTGDTGDDGGVGDGQSVHRSQVSGPVDQINQVRGDVEFDR